MPRPITAERGRIGNVIRRGLEKRRWTQLRLASEMGVTQTMVGMWCQGRYKPSLNKATRLAEILDEPLILQYTRVASIGTCLVCLKPFKRTERRGQYTRRLYCSARCRRDYHAGKRSDQRHPAELAIADFCRGCEPEGLCRTVDCPLRSFSPFPFVSMSAA